MLSPLSVWAAAMALFISFRVIGSSFTVATAGWPLITGKPCWEAPYGGAEIHSPSHTILTILNITANRFTNSPYMVATFGQKMGNRPSPSCSPSCSCSPSTRRHKKLAQTMSDGKAKKAAFPSAQSQDPLPISKDHTNPPKGLLRLCHRRFPPAWHPGQPGFFPANGLPDNRWAPAAVASLIGELPEAIGHFTRSGKGVAGVQKPKRNPTP